MGNCAHVSALPDCCPDCQISESMLIHRDLLLCSSERAKEFKNALAALYALCPSPPRTDESEETSTQKSRFIPSSALCSATVPRILGRNCCSQFAVVASRIVVTRSSPMTPAAWITP